MSPTRPPAVSGTFYPSLPARLRVDVTDYLVAPPRVRRVPAIVAPHAGYMYSGATAGVVFGSVEIPATCIVIAPNHTGLVAARRGGSVLTSSEYRTPLGDVKLDADLADALIHEARGLLEDDPAAHLNEHAVEVMLPFLQVRSPDVAIVPIICAWSDWDRCAELARAIFSAVDRRTDVLVVASSDMNHYEPADVTEKKDHLALEKVIELDGRALLEVTERHAISMCGRIPTATACEYARLRGKRVGEVIAYSHSGLVNQDHRRVVGYAGVLLGVD